MRMVMRRAVEKKASLPILFVLSLSVCTSCWCLEKSFLFVTPRSSRISVRDRCAKVAPVAAEPAPKQNPKYADDVMPDVTGAVRLYATHTLCISCLACCCQFKRLLPNVKLEVAFDVWRETRRWVGSGEEALTRFEAQEEQFGKSQ
mmetsp:Transcript_6109/g.11185  ORF Transcript_6109/g.11185 Transcript_6109/m.11185 type:complete len:146 (+) Transcript_6109:35-472(+)